MAPSGDEVDSSEDVPLHHLRPFGTGLHRKKIAFVPASSGDLETVNQQPEGQPNKSVGDLYLSIVLSKDSKQGQEAGSASQEAQATGAVELCEICKLPLPRKAEGEEGSAKSDSGSGAGTRASSGPKSHHEASLVHQVCLAHSHPPSAIDRSRLGLSVLGSQGWDPDARQGLGASGQGIQFPLKARPKADKLGLGVTAPRTPPPPKEKPAQKLDAGKVRKMAQQDRKRTEKLRQQIFGHVDLERYLGSGSSMS